MAPPRLAAPAVHADVDEGIEPGEQFVGALAHSLPARVAACPRDRVGARGNRGEALAREAQEALDQVQLVARQPAVAREAVQLAGVDPAQPLEGLAGSLGIGGVAVLLLGAGQPLVALITAGCPDFVGGRPGFNRNVPARSRPASASGALWTAAARGPISQT